MKVMRKINRKGFTLVETILAIFILFVVSSMLINGFIAAIAYSYQTSVYSKSGAKNTDICTQQIADWSNLTKPDRELSAYEAIEDDAETDTLKFQPQGGFTLGPIEVPVITSKKADLSGTVPLELNFADGRFAPSEEQNQFSDNRTIFKYYPTYCYNPNGDPDDTLGQIIVVHDKQENKYYWSVDSEKTDFSDDSWKPQIGD